MEKYLVRKKTSVKNVYMLTMIAVLLQLPLYWLFLSSCALSVFRRMDLSDLPALIGAFAYGPMASLFIHPDKTGRGAVNAFPFNLLKGGR